MTRPYHFLNNLEVKSDYQGVTLTVDINTGEKLRLLLDHPGFAQLVTKLVRSREFVEAERALYEELSHIPCPAGWRKE